MNASFRHPAWRGAAITGLLSTLFALLSGELCAAYGGPPSQGTPCRNHDGDGDPGDCNNEQGPGSNTSGYNNAGAPNQSTGNGWVDIYQGTYKTRITDYQVHRGTGAPPGGGGTGFVEVPHHAPFALEFRRYYHSRLWPIDHGLGWGWHHNLQYELRISEQGADRLASFAMPGPMTMHWVDPGSSGNWVDDSVDQQSMHLQLIDEPADEHLVVDRWGGRYHFRPNTGSGNTAQYVCDWLEDPNGHRLVLEYDGEGLLQQATGPFGRTLLFGWDLIHDGLYRITTVTLPDGAEIRYSYLTAAGNEIEVHYPEGDVASYGRGVDADGIYHYFNDPRGNPGSRKDRVYFYYEGNINTGRTRLLKDESGVRKLSREEDAGGSEDTIVEYADGRRFAFEYGQSENGEAEGLPCKVTDLITGAERKLEWNPTTGLLDTDEDADGETTTYEYDESRSLLTERVHPDGATETWTYNDLNLVETYRNARGFLTGFSYDAVGNLLSMAYPDGSIELWERDSGGFVTRYQDRNGNQSEYEYDLHGNLLLVRLAADPGDVRPEHRFTYDVHGRLLSWIDPEGHTTLYSYDAGQRFLGTEYSDGSTTMVVYGSMDPGSGTDPVGDAGLIVARKDRNDQWQYMEYGRDDRLSRSHGAAGDSQFEYDPSGRLLTRTVNGDRETLEYDSTGRLVATHRVVDIDKTLTTRFVYDLHNRVAERIDPYGFATTFEYDKRGRLERECRQIDAAEWAYRSFLYDANGNLIAETDPNGNTRTFEYDVNDRRIRAYDPAPYDSYYVEREYDANGNVIRETDQLGHTTERIFGARDLLLTEIDPVGRRVEHEYNLDNTIHRMVFEPLGSFREFHYSCCGRVTREVQSVNDSEVATTDFEYDGNGNLIRRIDPLGHVYTYEFDSRNRLLQSTDPLGFVTRNEFHDDAAGLDPNLIDGMGSTLRQTDAAGNVRTTVFDGVGRVVRVIDQAGNPYVYEFDALEAGERVQRETDQEGRRVAIYHDGLGRPVRRVLEHADPPSVLQIASYDLNGNVLSWTDGNGRVSEFEYDGLDRPVRERYPDHGDDGLELTRSFLPNSWLAEVHYESGVQLSFGYDGIGRPLAVDYSTRADPDRFEYDDATSSMVATSELYGHRTEILLDHTGQILEEWQDHLRVLYEYDLNSNNTAIHYPSGATLELDYDPRNQLRSGRFRDQQLFTATYDILGRLTQRRYANGVSTRFAYDPRGQVTGFALDGVVRGRQPGVRSVPHTLRYTYDRTGNLRAVHEGDGTGRSFGYDERQRLVDYRTGNFDTLPDQISQPEHQSTWELDAVGNWDSWTHDGVVEHRQHNAFHELTQIGTQPLTYDDEGNLTDDGIHSYAYDEHSRLQSVDGGATARYTYDAFHRRITRTTAGGTERFVYGDIWNVLEEYLDDELQAVFVHGKLTNEILFAERDLDSDGNFAGPQEQVYYVQDRQQSVLGLVNPVGELIASYQYGPYGEREVWGDGRGNPYGYTGARWDAESSLYFLRNRMYSPRLGRFTSRDPLGFQDGPCQYEYALSQPSVLVDPWGTAAQDPCSDDKECESVALAGFALDTTGLPDYSFGFIAVDTSFSAATNFEGKRCRVCCPENTDHAGEYVWTKHVQGGINFSLTMTIETLSLKFGIPPNIKFSFWGGAQGEFGGSGAFEASFCRNTCQNGSPLSWQICGTFGPMIQLSIGAMVKISWKWGWINFTISLGGTITGQIKWNAKLCFECNAEGACEMKPPVLGPITGSFTYRACFVLGCFSRTFNRTLS